jgi:hypothetical protein
MGATSKWIFLSWDSQMRVPKFPWLGLLHLWGRMILRANLQLWWSLKQSCSPGWKISNGMWHATYMWGNQVNSWLLVVGSQIASLIPDLSFDHNLCFRCPNGWCEPILDIYVSIDFQWHEELFKAMGFDPCNCALKIQESIWDSNYGSSLGSARVHSLTLFALMGACDVILGPPSWPATLQPPCLGREPKARVVTLSLFEHFAKYISSSM